MGTSTARRSVEVGHESLTTRDRSPSHAGLNAAILDTPADISERANTVIAILPDTPDVIRIRLDDKSVPAGKPVIGMPSINLIKAAQVAAVFAEKDVDNVDARGSGGAAGIKAASLTVMCGGAQDVSDHAVPFSRLWIRTPPCSERAAARSRPARSRIRSSQRSISKRSPRSRPSPEGRIAAQPIRTRR